MWHGGKSVEYVRNCWSGFAACLTPCLPEPNTPSNRRPFSTTGVRLFEATRTTSLLAISFSEDLYIYGLGHWVTSHRMHIYILGRQGVEQHKSYGQFSLCLWHIYWNGGEPAGEHGDPTLFLGRTEPMGLRTSPPLLLGSGWLGPHCLFHFAPQPTEHHCLLLVAGLVI